MNKVFVIVLSFTSLIPFTGTYAQKDLHEQHIDSLWKIAQFEEAYQYAKQRCLSLPANKSQAYKDAIIDYYRTTEMLETYYRYQENFKEALKLNDELLALKHNVDYSAIRNKIVCYSGLGDYEKAAENRALLYKAYKKKKLPCEHELCHYYNFDFFTIDTLNIWGYEWYDKLPKNRFSTSFTKVVYYVYSTNPDGSEKDQLYRLHLIMFHGKDMPFDYIMEKHISTENGEWRRSMYQYTYQENIDYEKLHHDVIEIVKENKKTDTRQNVSDKIQECFCPDSANISAETIGGREKTEYVYTEPYQEFNLFYGYYRRLNISLNGSVKSVVQTNVPVSLLKKDNSSEKINILQQTWKFSPSGQLCHCHINKTSIKDIQDYDFNDDKTLFGDKYDSTDTIAYYGFDSVGRMCQAIDEHYSSNKTFEYDDNGHLTKVATHYLDKDILIETLITLNDNWKPVRVEERRNGVERVGVIDTYCYDERGNKVAHQMHNGKTVQWMDYFVYDSLNNMIFEGRCDGYNGNNNSCNCREFRKSHGYEFDDQHNMIRQYSIGDWKPSGMDTYYQYDSAGREIEYKHYDVRGTQRTFDCHIQTTYDSAGRIVKKEALLGDFRINESIFDYIMADLEEWSYDEHGNLVEHIGYQTKVKPYKIVRYQYKYDQQGNWVIRIRYEGMSRDSMTATEVLERRIVYY